MTRSLVCSAAVHDAIRADPQAWADCERLGFNRWEAFDGEPAGQTEVRLCANCGSSIGIVTALPYSVTCDDGDDAPIYWCGVSNGHDGQGWSDRGDDALCVATRDDADLEVKAARNSFGEYDRRRTHVAVQEVV